MSLRQDGQKQLSYLRLAGSNAPMIPLPTFAALCTAAGTTTCALLAAPVVFINSEENRQPMETVGFVGFTRQLPRDRRR